MKRFLILTILSACAVAQTTTTITGTLKDLTQAVVTSGKVTFTLQPSRDTTISGIARFIPQTVTCLLNGSGQIKALDGVSACTVTMNTALQPPGSYYRVDVWPGYVKTSSFTFYAVLSAYDWSTVVPTPATSPAANFVDVFSNQTIGGVKTFGTLNANAVALSTLNAVNTGVFTNTQGNAYVTSQVGTNDPITFFHTTQAGYMTDAFTGIVTVPVGATVHQADGVSGTCVTAAVSSPLGSNENCVGVYGYSQVNASVGAGWGANFVAADAAGTTGTLIMGNEIDMGLAGAPKRFQGFFLTGTPLTGTMASGPVMGTIDVANHSASAFGVAFPNTSTAQFPVTFWSARGVAPIGLMLDAACYTGACNSQSIQLGSNTGSTALTATIQEDTSGNIVQSAGAIGAGVKPPQATFAQLGAASNGTIIYCTDCKNVPDNAAVAGAACITGGNGTVARRDNNRWDCN